MTTKKDKTEEIKHRIVKKAMDLAEEKGWERIGLREIAEAAEISLVDLHQMFEDKTDILVALGRIIDHKVLEGLGEGGSDSSPRDRLFDVLMDRYEALNAYRGGIHAVLESFKYDPKQAIISLPHLCRSMTWMLEAAGIETTGVKGAIKVAGLSGLYLKILRVWDEDDSPDLPKTMAALDKALSRAEQTAKTFGF